MTEQELMKELKSLSLIYWQTKITNEQFNTQALALIKEAGYKSPEECRVCAVSRPLYGLGH